MSSQTIEELKTIKKEVVELSERFYRYSRTPLPAELVKADITMSQLKLLLILSTEGQSNMSQVAVALGVALPTATGVVDRLVERGLIVRKADRLDRRVVLCALSDMGTALVERLWEIGKEQMYSVLQPLDLEELKAVSKALNILCRAAQTVHSENVARTKLSQE